MAGIEAKTMRFELNEAQVRVFEKWKAFKIQEFLRSYPDYEEEDCAPSSPFIFEFQGGSIGTTVKVYFTVDGAGLDLSLDDDNEWCNPLEGFHF